jgi:hypothetical protein
VEEGDAKTKMERDIGKQTERETKINTERDIGTHREREN